MRRPEREATVRTLWRHREWNPKSFHRQKWSVGRAAESNRQDMLAQNMWSTYDKIIRNMLVASASQIDCLNGVNGNAITEVTSTDIEIAVDYLEGNNAKKMSPNIEGVNAFGTAPVWAAYWMIIHTDLRSDFKKLANFLPVADYPRQQAVLEAEFGSVDEMRVVKTSEAYKDSSVSPAVYYMPMIGANAYGRISIDDQSMNMIIKPLGEGEDPLNQRQSMGWKGRLGAVLLDDAWAVILRATKS